MIQKEIMAPNINLTSIPAWTIATAEAPDIRFEYQIKHTFMNVRNKLTPNPTNNPSIIRRLFRKIPPTL